jgi:hypothetical protein
MRALMKADVGAKETALAVLITVVTISFERSQPRAEGTVN